MCLVFVWSIQHHVTQNQSCVLESNKIQHYFSNQASTGGESYHVSAKKISNQIVLQNSTHKDLRLAQTFSSLEKGKLFLFLFLYVLTDFFFNTFLKKKKKS